MSDAPSITCPVCERTSHHPEDVYQGYCGNCHDWTGAVAQLVSQDLNRARDMYFDRQGAPISFARWTWLFERGRREGETPYSRIAFDELRDNLAISTIWEGLAMSPFNPVPMIFETAVCVSGQWIAVRRYHSEGEARADHERLVGLAGDLGDRAYEVFKALFDLADDHEDEAGTDPSVSPDAMRWEPE